MNVLLSNAILNSRGEFNLIIEPVNNSSLKETGNSKNALKSNECTHFVSAHRNINARRKDKRLGF